MFPTTRKRRTVALIVGAMVAGGAGGAAWLWQSSAAPSVAAAPAAPAAAPPSVAALGRIEPQSELINVGSGISDRLETIMVRRGDLVKKDQVLAYLQSHSEQVAQRDQIAAQLAEAKVKLATEIELDLAKIESAEIKLRTVNEVSPMKIAAQELMIAGMEAMLKNNREILENQSQLFTRNATPKRIYRDQEAAVLQSESNIASAKARLTELKNQFEADRADGESQIRLAKAALERAKADFAIDSLSKQLALAEVRVRRATIYAPVDGRILNLLARAGELVGTTAVLTMGNTEKMRAVAEVYETDIGRIRVGQTARVVSRTLTTPVTGRVVEIGQMIFKNDVLNVDPAARADARIVEVRIELDDTERTQRLTNHTVDVTIDVGDMPVAQTSGAKPAP